MPSGSLGTVNFSATYAYPMPTQTAPAWGVVAGVCALHLLVLWLVHGGLRQEAQAPKPVVVTARLILQPSASAAPSLSLNKAAASVAPLPLPALAQPAPKPLARPQATVPAAGPAPTPASTAVPTYAPVLAVASSAAPAFSAPLAAPGLATAATSPVPAALSAPVSAPTGTAVAALGASPTAAHDSSGGPVRVAAALQASGTCAKPAYPELSRRREEQGSVQLKFLVAADGHVVESQIEQSSGYPRLDEAARAGLSKCQFKPGTVDGKPEASWARMKYVWKLVNSVE